jgi:hypothetical protein
MSIQHQHLNLGKHLIVIRTAAEEETIPCRNIVMHMCVCTDPDKNQHQQPLTIAHGPSDHDVHQ